MIRIVAVDRVSQAYDLAEHHNDYDTLVWLCHEPAAAASGKGGVVRLQEYIERFEEQFAFVLYQWYIDQGKLLHTHCPRPRIEKRAYS